MDNERKLYKSRTDVKIDGVCAGLAAYLNVDVTIVRLIWAVATLPLVGTSILAYVICALLIPREP